MFEDALTYPTRGDDALQTLLIGGGLAIVAGVISIVAALLSVILVGFLLFPLVLVPAILVRGYVVSVVRHRLAGDPTPPKFEDWTALFVDGLKSIVVAIGYAIPGVLLFVAIAVVGISVAGVGAQSASAAVGGSLVLVVLSLVLFAYGLLASYLYPAAVANWVREDDLTAAFSPGAMRDATFDARYAVAWLLAAVIVVIGGFVGQLLVVILVGFVVLFYVRIAAWYCLTEGYVEGMDGDRTNGTPTDGETRRNPAESTASASRTPTPDDPVRAGDAHDVTDGSPDDGESGGPTNDESDTGAETDTDDGAERDEDR